MRRKRTMFQMKEKGKITRELNEMEISNMCDICDNIYVNICENLK